MLGCGDAAGLAIYVYAQMLFSETLGYSDMFAMAGVEGEC